MIRLLSASLILCCLSQARAEHFKFYGDSLTAGHLAETNVTDPPPLSIISNILSDFTMYWFSQDPALVNKYQKRELSYGQTVFNLAHGETLTIRGVVGTKSDHLAEQIDPRDPINEDVVAFFFIGHNDLQEDLPAKEMARVFKANVRQTLVKWDKFHQQSRAVLVPIGKVYRVFEVLSGFRWHNNYRCEDSWSTLFPYSRKYALHVDKGMIREILKPKIDAMNQALIELAAETPEKPTNQIKFLNDPHGDYEPEHFAIDCFHMSAKGHEEFGRAVFDQFRRG